MADQIIYSDPHVTVTTSRVMITGTTYALRNITSVRMIQTPPQNGCAIGLIVVGGLMAFCGFAGFATDDGMMAFATILPAVAVLVGGVIWFRSCKTLFHLGIASASGETHAFTSHDPNYIAHLVNCINEAIVRYR